MRRRLVISTIAIVLVVLGALAVPVGLIVYNAAEQQLQSELADQAASIADSISQSALTDGEPDYARAAAVVDEEDGIRIIADGVVAAAKETAIKVPLVVRLEGTNVDQGKQILAQSGLKIVPADNLADAAKKITDEVKKVA